MTESVHLLGRGGTPVGVLNKPDHPMSDVAVIFLNSGLLHRVGPFRLYVELARRLSSAGIASLRIDQSGKGDSERRRGLSFVESVTKDLEDASNFLKRTIGVERFVLLGLCSGADDALFLASTRSDVVGAVLLEPYVSKTLRYYLRHYGPRLLRLDLWWIWARRVATAGVKKVRRLWPGRFPDDVTESPDMHALRELPSHRQLDEGVRAVLGRGGKLLCVFTDGARRYYNYKGQLADCLRLPQDSDGIAELYLPWAKHTYPLVADRDEVVEHILTWFNASFDHQIASGDGQERKDSAVA